MSEDPLAKRIKDALGFDGPAPAEIVAKRDGVVAVDLPGYQVFINDEPVTEIPTPFKKGDRIRTVLVQ